ncbi:LLM class flavin-dependent oxidoreductase [Microlunatus flavus]|uniref:Luciferase-like monooxygenase n=1 Tax=Microlunatus flavus TaxID=1036181 RepID=A0A1H9I243_9ACTN|nr:LLM class flavin-dependent oxidoreductase [Microlunatus flavus]SEQ68656.1 Luciferase-like monooxygenase [Microlunatus flavus]
MRVGITLLPELAWAVDRGRWQAVEAFGYDHAWTFDHLAWRSLADKPWFATVPTLTAAALSTTTLRLGTWVATPNFRHPVPFAKELLTLDHLSGGRLDVGLGAGTDGFDASMLGQPALSPGRRHARFAEFVEVLGLVLGAPESSWSGDWYAVDAARTVPACVQRPHPPFVVAANGPKGMRLALERGDAWVTTTGAGPDDDAEVWWASAADKAGRFAEVRAAYEAEGHAVPGGFARFLNLEARTSDFSCVEQVVDALGRAAGLGFTDAVLAWPRPDGPMAGDPGLVEAVAARLPEVQAL